MNAILFAVLLAAATPRTVEVSVTDAGFVPARIEVKKGEPVKLVVTRKTDRTCATEIKIEGQGEARKLPLNKAVEIEFTPAKAGKVRYACGMDMLSGVIVVQ